MACGVRAACASNSACAVSGPPAGSARAVSFQSCSTLRRSAGVSSSSSDRRRSGSPSALCSSCCRWPAMAAMVDASNRSVAYSMYMARPLFSSLANRVRSTREVPDEMTPGSIGDSTSPCRRISSDGKFWKNSITWNSGEWLSERSIFSTSSRRSTGMSWCAYAPRVPSLTRASSSRKVGSPLRSVRSARVLAKKPTSASSSWRGRLATPMPMIRSSWPV